jgi:type IV pilus assembly protein PilA
MKRPCIVAYAVTIACLATAASAPAVTGSATTLDSKAKSNARNMTSLVESCYTDTQDYSKCRTASQLENDSMGMFHAPIGSKPGQVRVAKASKETYTIDAYSKSGNHFLVVKRSNGGTTRKCTKAGRGGCRANGTW